MRKLKVYKVDDGEFHWYAAYNKKQAKELHKDCWDTEDFKNAKITKIKKLDEDFKFEGELTALQKLLEQSNEPRMLATSAC